MGGRSRCQSQAAVVYVYLVSGGHYPQLRLDYIQYHFIREGVNKFSYNEHLHQEWLKMVFTCPLILQYLVQKFRFSFLTVSYKTYKRINIATSLFADCESSFRGTTTIYSLAWLALHAWIRNSCTKSNVEIVTRYVEIVVTYLPKFL